MCERVLKKACIKLGTKVRYWKS